MRTNILLAQLERIAIAKSQIGQHDKAKAIWSKIEQIQQREVLDLLKAIELFEDDMVWALQHGQSDADQLMREALQRRANAVHRLGEYAPWLAKRVLKSWVNEQAVVKATVEEVSADATH